MLSSLSIGSLDNLEKLPINSLNSICERVRQALLHVFLPRLCEKCQPAFSEVFRKTQSTPILLKALCEPCKINYIKDKRSVSRKKTKSEVLVENFDTDLNFNTNDNSISILKNYTRENIDIKNISKLQNQIKDTSVKFSPAKKKQKVDVIPSDVYVSKSNLIGNLNLTVKIKLIGNPSTSTSSSSSSSSSTSTSTSKSVTPFNHPLPITPPPTIEDMKLLKEDKDEELTIYIDNTQDNDFEIERKQEKNHYYHVYPVRNTQIYEMFSEKGVDWCRYCGVAGETGTFWKLGPWGDRSLCHKHGCEFFGCGFARVTKTRLDLTKFYGEKRAERKRPIVSEYCSICWKSFEFESEENILSSSYSSVLSCHGCPLSFHTNCLATSAMSIKLTTPFYCSESCSTSNFENCLIRPQFPSKSKFPFYRQILTIENSVIPPIKSENENLKLLRLNLDLDKKLKLQLQSQSQSQSKSQSHYTKTNIKNNSLLMKKRKYNRKHHQQIDRVIPFLLHPIKVDQSIHKHENITTPHWTVKSFQERMNYSADMDDECYYTPEVMDDNIILNRHSRYEHVEKTTRLLKPGVLKELISSSSND